MRFVPVSETSSRRSTFTLNLKQLLELLPGNLKHAAEEELDVPYQWLRRMVSSGTSRPDPRSQNDLGKVARYFALPSVTDLWRPNLVCWLVQADEGERFRRKFRKQISRLVKEEADRADRICAEQAKFDYPRFAAMKKLVLRDVISGPHPFETLPMTIEELSRCLEELGFPGMMSVIQRWRKGEVPTSRSEETQGLKTGTDEVVL